MGLEATCRVHAGGKSALARVLLETDEVRVRGDLRLAIPLAAVTGVEAADGRLVLTWPDGTAGFELGDAAERWAARIRSPRSLLDKLDVKPGYRVVLLGMDDRAFRSQLVARAGEVSTRLRKGADLIFYAAERKTDLERLSRLRDHLHPAGAIWVVRPKGTTALTEADVIAAARAAGLVDVKVARFSETHTAEKLVIPVSRRPPRPAAPAKGPRTSR